MQVLASVHEPGSEVTYSQEFGSLTGAWASLWQHRFDAMPSEDSILIDKGLTTLRSAMHSKLVGSVWCVRPDAADPLDTGIIYTVRPREEGDERS